MIDRRTLLRGTGVAAGGLLFAPRLAFAAPAATDRRFVFLIQRGAADGLETLIPYGDPGYARLRGAIQRPGGIGLDRIEIGIEVNINVHRAISCR